MREKNKEQMQPDLWCREKLGEVLDIKGGSQPPKSEFIYEPKEGYIQLLQIRDFGDKPVPTYVPINRVTKFCKKDDVLIARYGASLGRIVTGFEGAYNVALARVIFDDRLFLGRYLFYLLKTSIFQTPLKMISRSAQNGFAKHEIAHIWLPIPPYNEQHRIVAKIEELFSELDNGIESLKTAREQLKVYRQAVLKHAFEGKLTAQWREEKKDDVQGSTSAASAGRAGAAKLETADDVQGSTSAAGAGRAGAAQLLARIQKEREVRYRQQMEKWRAAAESWVKNGKEGKKPTKPKKPVVTGNPEIPEDLAKHCTDY